MTETMRLKRKTCPTYYSVKIRYSAMAKTRCYLAGLVKYFGSFTCDNHQRRNKVMWLLKLQDVMNSFAFPDKT